MITEIPLPCLVPGILTLLETAIRWPTAIYWLLQPMLYPTTARSHYQRYQGLEKSSARQVLSRHKPDWVVREIIYLKAISNASCHKIAALFNDRFAARGMTVGKTFVADTIRKNRYAIQLRRTHWKRRVPRPLPRNLIWGMDMTGKGDTGGEINSIAGIIDHGSRLAVTLKPIRERTSIALLKVLIEAIETCGTPKILKTDNEPCLTSRTFSLGLWILGIRQHRSQPGHPWQNGRIERFFLTLKEKLHQLQVADFTDLSQAMCEFWFWYNAVRHHQHLSGRTPLQAWQGIDPWQTPPTAAHWFEAWDGLLAGYYLRR